MMGHHRSNHPISDPFPALNAKGIIMPNIRISLVSSLVLIEHSLCPKCGGQMLLSGMVRTFECIACVEEIATRTRMMRWINSSGLRPPR
jgi:tRNA(Ile2) C34 agmatinyltransferase TiaS